MEKSVRKYSQNGQLGNVDRKTSRLPIFKFTLWLHWETTKFKVQVNGKQSERKIERILKIDS